MTRKTIRTRVGPNGVLLLSVALDPADANREVTVTVEETASVAPMTTEAWSRFIRQTAGSITDPTFERPPQGEFEQRDPLL